MDEIYKLFNGTHWVSNYGNVYTIHRKTLLNWTSNKRYCQFKSKYKRYYVHRVVYDLFGEDSTFELNGNINKSMVIDHIDRNTQNNHIDNLRYISQSLNIINQNIGEPSDMKNGFYQLTIGGQSISSKSPKELKLIKLLYNYIKLKNE